MAATVALALAQVPEPKLNRVAYSAKPIHRAPENRRLADALGGFDPEQLKALAWHLVCRRSDSIHDADEAVAEELVFLIGERPEVFTWEEDRWLSLLFWRGWYRLLKNCGAPRTASTDALEDELGDSALAKAQSCVPVAPQTEEDAVSTPLPLPGEAWSRQQSISALQRFHRYYGRPPRVRDCNAMDRLPSYSMIRHQFGGFEKALMAAGIVPAEFGRRRRRWSQIEAARACRSFYREKGYWPDAGDARRHSGVLPGRSVMLRCFGSTRGGEIREVAEAILKAAD